MGMGIGEQGCHVLAKLAHKKKMRFKLVNFTSLELLPRARG